MRTYEELRQKLDNINHNKWTNADIRGMKDEWREQLYDFLINDSEYGNSKINKGILEQIFLFTNIYRPEVISFNDFEFSMRFLKDLISLNKKVSEFTVDHNIIDSLDNSGLDYRVTE